MIEFINALTGSQMWVHESRVEEYLAAGHRLAAGESPEKQPVKEAPKKSSAKRKK